MNRAWRVHGGELRLTCPSCNGDGTIQSADNFPTCDLCHGHGMVTEARLEREIEREMRGTYDMQDRGRAWQRRLDEARRAAAT